jgi:hypothetical protein
MSCHIPSAHTSDRIRAVFCSLSSLGHWGSQGTHMSGAFWKQYPSLPTLSVPIRGSHLKEWQTLGVLWEAG